MPVQRIPRYVLLFKELLKHTESSDPQYHTIEEVLKDKLSGNFEDCMVALLDLPEVYDAKLLNKAISGAGTDEDLLSEVIATRPKWRLEEIKEQYEKLYKVIENKTNFYLMIADNQGYLVLKENCDDNLIKFINDLKSKKE